MWVSSWLVSVIFSSSSATSIVRYLVKTEFPSHALIPGSIREWAGVLLCMRVTRPAGEHRRAAGATEFQLWGKLTNSSDVDVRAEAAADAITLETSGTSMRQAPPSETA